MIKVLRYLLLALEYSVAFTRCRLIYAPVCFRYIGNTCKHLNKLLHGKYNTSLIDIIHALQYYSWILQHLPGYLEPVCILLVGILLVLVPVQRPDSPRICLQITNFVNLGLIPARRLK